jgi:hypothetical protein
MLGKALGIMQVCHGKQGPLKRVTPGDRVVYYSPSQQFKGKDKLQAFTAIGYVKPGDPYQVDMGQGFEPYRRDVTWLFGQDAEILPLLDRLEFTAGSPQWGARFRYGLFDVGDTDFQVIADAMEVRIP